ncbi:hypothetical protein NSP23_24520, partial [Salmonella enterica]|nr:hypothetical protein [Salmonella enterica]
MFRKPPIKKAAKKQPAPKALRAERAYSVAGRSLPLSVWENPRAKRLTLRIETGGKAIRVTVPPRLPER